MTFTTKLLGAACAIALGLSATAASADVSGTVDATYGHGSNSVGSMWDANGALAFDTGWNNIGLEGNVGYAHTDGSGGHSWDFGGSVVWSGSNTRFAGSVIHYSNTGFNETTYGAGVQYFPNPAWDFYAQGGGITGTLHGGNIGGGVNWYACPNFALNGDIHYGSLNVFNETDYTLKGEWLISDSTPISINGGWTHSDISGFTSNVFFIGLKLYANAGSASTLADRKHTGALNDIGPIHPLAFTF